MTVAQRTRVGHEANVSPRAAGRTSRAPSTQPRSDLELGMIRLPGRMRRALGLFRNITGLTAVTGLAAPPGNSEVPPSLSPPVHPRCAKRLRSGRTAPCRKQWIIHLRSSRRSPSVHSHICPIGLRCSCVPIQFDGHLIGVAKLVVGSETSARRFSAATSVLELIVGGVCQDSLASGRSEEVDVLRQRLAEMRQVQSKGSLAADSSNPPVAAPGLSAAQRRNLTLVESALSHLHRHYQTPALSLEAVAGALACNPRYLTTRFTLVVGEHMHAYLVRLRVAHACRLLMDTAVPIKEAAYDSGFPGNAGLARAFRRHVGVSPGEYRRIFAAR
jgi:AraC-like DNA-binding protein